MNPAVQTQGSFDSVSDARNQRYPVAASRKPIELSGRRQRATSPATTNERPAVTATAAVSQGLSLRSFVKTSAIATAASTSAAAPASAKRSGLTAAAL